MSNGSLARRYAKALFQLGNDEGQLSQLGTQLDGFSQTLKGSDELMSTLVHPAIPKSKREGILVKVLEKCGSSKTLLNFCKILMEKERIEHLPDISRELNVLIQDQEGRAEAHVLSAAALSASQLSQLTEKLEKLAGRKIDIETEVDPSLLGGVVATIGDMVYDGSIKTQLQKLQDPTD